MQQSAQTLLFQTLDALLLDNEIDKAIEVLLDFDKKTKAGIGTDVSGIAATYKSAVREFRVKQTIPFEEFRRYESSARNGLQQIIADLPDTLRLNAQLQGLGTYQFEVPDDARLEKIIGQQNNLLKINWLEQALQASRAVCRVVCADGELGTGFVTKEGYLFTNNHVLPDAQIAADAKIEFNYQMNTAGKIETRTAYRLDASDFVTSTPDQLDFSRVRIIDRPEVPLRQWGFVEFDPSATPSVGEAVTIIQHPKGEDKQIALNANDVLGVWNQHIFYATDTEPGSSGSPVFNRDWKVVAIHHAGKTEAEGGLQINARGDRRGANRGILFEHIFAFLGGKAPAASTGEGRNSTESVSQPTLPPDPTPVPTPVVKPTQPVAPTTPPPPAIKSPAHLVVLYDLSDDPQCTLLNKHLTGLRLAKKVTIYNIHKALAGEDVLARADEELAKADFILLLVSSNLFNDEATWFGKATDAVDQNRRVVPILIDDVSLTDFNLGKLRPLPSPNKTVAQLSREQSPDAAYKTVADGIALMIKS
jgi:V8-like Glu-specific endopeptidase